MGKPFKKEIQLMPETFDWASKVDTNQISSLIQDGSRPIIFVGSGGSFSACHFAYKTVISKGTVAYCFTPLQLFENMALAKRSHVVVLSASGNNNDTLNVIKYCLQEEVCKVTAFVLSNRSKVKKLYKEDNRLNIIQFNLPLGKDGFLATNSLLAFILLIYKASKKSSMSFDDLAFDASQITESVNSFFREFTELNTISVIYSDWFTPVALDIESKFSEAALGNVLLSDWRNFAHGRHHWFDKRNSDTGILALISPNIKAVAEKTLSLLPDHVRILKFYSPFNDSKTAIEGLMMAFYLVQARGMALSIDPGKPGVPDYGSKVYNLKYQRLLLENKLSKVELFVSRKLPIDHANNLTIREVWANHYKTFYNRLKSVSFQSIVFDYDDTLCGSRREDRFKESLDERISGPINDLLSKGINIGIATGRGESAGKSLRASINKEYWNHVVMGYYNGSQISLLSEINIPRKTGGINTELTEAAKFLSKVIGQDLSEYLRPNQITLRMDQVENWSLNRQILREEIELRFPALRVLESSHSIDIIPYEVTKLDVVTWFESRNDIMENGEVLCIGDRGKWPGNDFQLLSHKFSLSVDEVSSSSDSCWNLAPKGVRKIDATINYLNRLRFHEGVLRFDI